MDEFKMEGLVGHGPHNQKSHGRRGDGEQSNTERRTVTQHNSGRLDGQPGNKDAAGKRAGVTGRHGALSTARGDARYFRNKALKLPASQRKAHLIKRAQIPALPSEGKE